MCLCVQGETLAHRSPRSSPCRCLNSTGSLAPIDSPPVRYTPYVHGVSYREGRVPHAIAMNCLALQSTPHIHILCCILHGGRCVYVSRMGTAHLPLSSSMYISRRSSTITDCTRGSLLPPAYPSPRPPPCKTRHTLYTLCILRGEGWRYRFWGDYHEKRPLTWRGGVSMCGTLCICTRTLYAVSVLH